MVYGGISLFVVVFAIYPIALDLFREADLPRRLIPGCIACGAFTFAMTAFPGSPQLNNIIPSKYFGTTAMAGPVLGIIAGILMLVLGVLWLERSARKMVANGEHFDEPKNGVAEDNLPHRFRRRGDGQVGVALVAPFAHLGGRKAARMRRGDALDWLARFRRCRPRLFGFGMVLSYHGSPLLHQNRLLPLISIFLYYMSTPPQKQAPDAMLQIIQNLAPLRENPGRPAAGPVVSLLWIKSGGRHTMRI